MGILDEIEGQAALAGHHQASQSKAEAEAQAYEVFAPKCRKIFIPLAVVGAFIPIFGWPVTLWCWLFVESYRHSLNAKKSGTEVAGAVVLYCVITTAVLWISGDWGGPVGDEMMVFYGLAAVQVYFLLSSYRAVVKSARITRAAADYINQQSEH